MKRLFPDTFTLPELQKAYEKILNIELDRRNFRKKLLSSGIVEETNQMIKKEKSKPSKLYKFANENKKFKFYS